MLWSCFGTVFFIVWSRIAFEGISQKQDQAKQQHSTFKIAKKKILQDEPEHECRGPKEGHIDQPEVVIYLYFLNDNGSKAKDQGNVSDIGSNNIPHYNLRVSSEHGGYGGR